MYQPIYKERLSHLRGALCMALAALLLTACAAASQAPTGALTEAREAIASAEQDGARQHAGAELDEARQKLEQAEQSLP